MHLSYKILYDIFSSLLYIISLKDSRLTTEREKEEKKAEAKSSNPFTLVKNLKLYLEKISKKNEFSNSS